MNGILRKHWFHVSGHFSLDCLLFYVGFVTGGILRFGEEFPPVLWRYSPVLVVAGICCSAVIYIFSLYSTRNLSDGIVKRAALSAIAVILGIALMIGINYLDFSQPLGRGAVLLGALISYVLMVLHHVWIWRGLRHAKERVAYIVACAFDEMETRLFQSFGGHRLELVGLIEYHDYRASGSTPVLGNARHLADIIRRKKISRVLCTQKSLNDPALCQQYCQLRYSGITVMPLISLCEEIEQYVPLELVTPDWLLNASAEPHLLYIRRVKRLFDVVASLAGLVLSLPILLAGMAAVKLSSRGPVFYRQTRCGRFGREFEIVKLRTMRTDAEEGGAVWCQGHDDPRITPAGRLLRKYRIDELPQLWHVLVGNMSFVGPRPERPEMVKDLADRIPFYRERLMVQPGITGWAQVNYPYGASVADARRKLEYDLYYMKQMSLFLDTFILLDTVRIVLRGGAIEPEPAPSRLEAIQQWERERQQETAKATETGIEVPA